MPLGYSVGNVKCGGTLKNIARIMFDRWKEVNRKERKAERIKETMRGMHGIGVLFDGNGKG